MGMIVSPLAGACAGSALDQIKLCQPRLPLFVGTSVVSHVVSGQIGSGGSGRLPWLAPGVDPIA